MTPDDQRLGDYLDEWLERRRSQLRPTTHRSYRQLIRCYLVPVLGDRSVAELDRRRLERTYAQLLAHGGHNGRALSPKTVRYCHAVLRRALEDARVDGLVDTNPADHARPPRHDPAVEQLDDDLQVWTANQAAAFLAFVDDHEWRALWHLAVGTGARRGELLGLRWRDVGLDDGQVRIRRSLSVVNGVGTPVKVVSERLGHSTIAMTMDVYGHLLPGMDANAVAQFDEALWAPPGR